MTPFLHFTLGINMRSLAHNRKTKRRKVTPEMAQTFGVPSQEKIRRLLKTRIQQCLSSGGGVLVPSTQLLLPEERPEAWTDPLSLLHIPLVCHTPEILTQGRCICPLCGKCTPQIASYKHRWVQHRSFKAILLYISYKCALDGQPGLEFNTVSDTYLKENPGLVTSFLCCSCFKHSFCF